MKSRFIIIMAFVLVAAFMMSCATTGDLKKLQGEVDAASLKADQAMAKADQATRDAAAATAAVQGAQAECRKATEAANAAPRRRTGGGSR